MIDRLVTLLMDPEAGRRRQLLARVDLFSGLPASAVAKIQEAVSEHLYRQGDVLFQEGEPGRALLILETGKVEVFKTPQGGRRHLRFIHAGEYLGEMALLDTAPRSASALAVEDTKCFLLHKNQLEGLMSRYPAIGMAVFSHFARVLTRRFMELESKAHATAVGSAASSAAGPSAARVGDLEAALGRMALELDRHRRLLAEKGIKPPA